MVRQDHMPKGAIPLDDRPGNGWVMLSKDQLLEAAGLVGDFEVLGVRWYEATQELKVQLRSFDIPWVGGLIVSTSPIRTEKQERDGR